MRLLVARLVWLLRATFVSRGALVLENLALRQPLDFASRFGLRLPIRMLGGVSAGFAAPPQSWAAATNPSRH